MGTGAHGGHTGQAGGLQGGGEGHGGGVGHINGEGFGQAGILHGGQGFGIGQEIAVLQGGHSGQVWPSWVGHFGHCHPVNFLSSK